MHGTVQQFTPTGTLAQESHFMNGKPEGKARIFTETGAVSSQISFINGVAIDCSENGEPCTPSTDGLQNDTDLEKPEEATQPDEEMP